jgi:hypothetical protein
MNDTPADQQESSTQTDAPKGVPHLPPEGSLGANRFTFTGDRTSITFFPVAPGPLHVGQEGGRLVYQGPEGDFTFNGKEITRVDSALGTLLTVVLHVNTDAGGLTITVVVPPAIGVTRNHPVTFATFAVKTSSRGFILTPGVQFTYTLLPLAGVAEEVILPL